MMTPRAFSRFRWCVLALLAALSIWNFWSMITFTCAMFNSPIEDMSHGWVVPFFSIYLIWRQREELKAAARGPSIAGCLAVAGMLVLAWFGGRGGQSRLEQVAMIGLVWAFPYALWGRGVARLMVFPAAFLLFTVPVSSFIDFFTIHLRIFSSSIATGLLNGLGLDVHRSGTALFSRTAGAEFSVDVADPCSGIRSLFAMMALAAGYGYLTQKTIVRKWLLFISSIPIAMVGNMFRIMSICLVASAFGQDVATGFYHDYSGYVIFLVGIGLVLAFSKYLDRSGEKFERLFHLDKWCVQCSDGAGQTAGEAAPGTPAAVAQVCAVAVVTVLVFVANSRMPDAVFDSDDFVCRDLPDRVGEFVGVKPYFCHNDQCLATVTPGEVPPSCRKEDGTLLCPACKTPLATVSLGEYTDLPKDTVIVKRNYRSPDGLQYSVSVVIGGRQRNSIHRAELCLPAQGYAMLGAEKMPLHILPGGDAIRVRRVRAQRAGSVVLSLIYWFESRDRSCCSHSVRILTDVWDRSIHNRINRWVMIAVNVSDDLVSEEAMERFEGFMSELYRQVIQKEQGAE